MRTKLLGCVMLLLGGSLAQAQPWPDYSAGGHLPPLASPPARPVGVYYGVSAPQQPPVQPAQFGYNYNPHVPRGVYAGVSHPRYEENAPPTYYGPAEPVPYYVPGPGAAPPPYNPFAPLPRREQPPLGREPTWPAPIDESETPPVAFHRPTHEVFWITADYIGAFIRPMRLNGPLVTLGSTADTFPGALGQPSTTVIFPTERADFGLYSGFRINGGLFLDNDNLFSLEAGGFWAFQRTRSFTRGGDDTGSPVISRPIFDLGAAREGAAVNSLPGAFTGAITIDLESQMAGAEFNARCHAYKWQRFHADALVGFRYLGLTERLRIRESLRPLADDVLTFQLASVNAPNELADEDSFRTSNHFFGPQIGTRLSWEHQWFSIGAFSKIAVGATRQNVHIDGSTTLITPAGNQTVGGGILALPSNSGSHGRTRFGIIPELGVNLGVELTQHCRLQFGYSILWWNEVVRPGTHYSRAVTPGLAPSSPTFGTVAGQVGPTFRFNDENFWTHMFNLGLEIHY